MREINIVLPKEIVEKIKEIEPEIKEIINEIRSSEENTNMKIRYVIIIISSLAEYAIKRIRRLIIGNSNEHIINYFEKKDKTEPLYAKRESFMKVINSFDIKIESITFEKLCKRNKAKLFEDKNDFNTFEEKIFKDRNKAAHALLPQFNILDFELSKMYDFILFLVSDIYIKIKEKLNISVDEKEIQSFNKYEEAFFIKNLLKEGIVYFKREEPFNSNSAILIEENLNKFSNDEWKFILEKIRKQDNTDKGNIINVESEEYCNIINNVNILKSAKNNNNYIESEQAVEFLIQNLKENLNIVTLPFYLDEKVIIFGKNEIEKYLSLREE